ncbi:MAG TPA: APC family permease [Anaerolineae bacterium]|nr:APC family permease [Anaerolineae bacterium]
MSYSSIKRFLVGEPLPTERLYEEKLPKRYALAVFSSDALSSTAYATEEILLVLVLAGAAALSLSLPIALAIVLLLSIVVISYRQLILAYPSGGGAYVVAKENLGEMASLIAGASLLIDYSLTVAVSVTAGVAAITSAAPVLIPYKVELSLIAVVLLVIANLRGVRESGKIFAVPTYAFIFGLALTVAVGYFRYLTGHTFIPSGRIGVSVEPITIILILRAFASGCAALTGVEAISNGVPSFRHPEAVNARTTLVLMALILGLLFLGLTGLSRLFGVVPTATETVVSQIARGVFGTGVFYYYIQAVTALILIIAANTSFAGFPNLASVMAADRYMPRQLKSRGDRLAFSNGIILLAAVAAILIVVFGANTHGLIPLYAIGVFTGFTLSQFGMVKYWYSDRSNLGWRRRALINGVGGMATLIVTIVLAIAKFIDGAWIVIVAIPVIILILKRIYAHYLSVAGQLSLEQLKAAPPIKHNVVILISTVHIGTVKAVQYAKSLNPTVIRAIHVDVDPSETAKVVKRWDQMGFGLPLEILESPYRGITGPIITRLREIDAEMEDDIVTVIIPEFVVSRWWQNFLHNQTALTLKARLLFWRNIVVIGIPYHLR